LDSYYCDRSDLSDAARAAVNFDEPDALEWPLIRAHVNALAAGDSIRVPQYDFSTHLRTPETRELQATPFIILEGLFALHDPQVRRQCDLLVFVDAPSDVMLERRILRDVRERGRTRESVTSRYAAHVQPMAVRHVLPTRAFANVVIDGTAPPQDSARRLAERIIAARGRKESLS
jgi:uridine kinase